MNRTLELMQNDFESSSRNTPQWSYFCRTAKRELEKELQKNIGIKKYEFHKGHFYFSGFFTTLDNKIYYFMTSDFRYFANEKMLIRTAKSYSDYTGGRNCYITIQENMFVNKILPRE